MIGITTCIDTLVPISGYAVLLRESCVGTKGHCMHAEFQHVYHAFSITLMLNMWVQLESLKATTDTKEVSFKIAYGLPLAEMLRWGLYISGAVYFIPAV